MSYNNNAGGGRKNRNNFSKAKFNQVNNAKRRKKRRNKSRRRRNTHRNRNSNRYRRYSPSPTARRPTREPLSNPFQPILLVDTPYGPTPPATILNAFGFLSQSNPGLAQHILGESIQREVQVQQQMVANINAYNGIAQKRMTEIFAQQQQSAMVGRNADSERLEDQRRRGRDIKREYDDSEDRDISRSRSRSREDRNDDENDDRREPSKSEDEDKDNYNDSIPDNPAERLKDQRQRRRDVNTASEDRDRSESPSRSRYRDRNDQKDARLKELFVYTDSESDDNESPDESLNARKSQKFKDHSQNPSNVINTDISLKRDKSIVNADSLTQNEPESDSTDKSMIKSS